MCQFFFGHRLAQASFSRDILVRWVHMASFDIHLSTRLHVGALGKAFSRAFLASSEWFHNVLHGFPWLLGAF